MKKHLNFNKSYCLIILLVFCASNMQCQDTPLGNKIVGNGDPQNYYIGHYISPGSDGLDLHWYGGIRFGDWTGNSVMQIVNGRVGIGTTNPNSQLNVGTSTANSPSAVAQFGISKINDEARVLSLVNSGGGSDQSTSIDFHNAPNWSPTGKIQVQQVGSDTKSKLNFFTYNEGLNNRMTINENGNIGIGTINPLAKLEINKGNILVKNMGNNDNSSSIMIGQSISEGNYTTFGTSINSITQNGGNNTYGMQFFTQESYLTNQTEKVRIQGNGNVGIGTTAPDEKLTVKGKIHTQEVRVDMLGSLVPDYVFDNDYKIKPLQEVENFIKANKHLPEIPSAAEFEKNGLLLAEMNMSLLKKIEELTLYMIELKKENQKQNEKITALETKLKDDE